ncbi:MAG TPA: 1,4-alpha-glucan branching protein GlgB [Oscillatoriaceae cyanobacterium]
MTTTTALLTDFDLHLLSEGTHYRTYEKLGAHVKKVDGVVGTHFAVWAPNAAEVSVIGDFNGWKWGETPLALRPEAGVWEAFVPGVKQGALYKYAIASQVDNYHVEKSDPYAFASEIRPKTASKVWELEGYQWGDKDWISKRTETNAPDAAMSIYEVHLGSWMRVPEEGNRWLTYRELAPKLVAYVKKMGFTHVEFLPLSEHPFDGSWGYQTIGYYSPTSRFGNPQDLMYLIDQLHQSDIGVILDWVPAHFPKDEHGLGYFDGTHLYEHADPRQGEHVHWGTFIFNYGRNEVRNFLISNALFWIDKYHIDGLRVDAVASMLYLDYGREGGGWVPNRFGGRENLEAIDFVRLFNERIDEEYPGVVTIAEESTAWPMVSRPTYLGGLGFGLKWNMGWMHDMLKYMSQDPIYRSYAHNNLTFSMMYAYSENFVLPFSHDEVVHLKKSMLGKMPGDDWQKFANLRLLYGFMTGHPGKKLLFMGQEFGQWAEWNHDTSLDWHLTEQPLHKGLQQWVADLNRLYRDEPAMHEGDTQEWGFKWLDCDDNLLSVVSFMRQSEDADTALVFVCNFTPVARDGYRIGVPWGGRWTEVLNSDAAVYGGSGAGNQGGVEAEDVPWHGREHSLSLKLPPLGVLVFEAKKPPEPIAEAIEEAEPEAEAAAESVAEEESPAA